MTARTTTSGIAKSAGTIALIALGAIVTYVQSRPSASGAGTSSGSSVGAPPSTPPASESVPIERSKQSPGSDAKTSPKPVAKASADQTTSAPQVSSDASGDVRVGAWNIEWLGKPDDRSGAAQGVAQDPDELAEYIVKSKVAVLGVCEIVTNVRGRPIRSREIEQTIERIRAKTGDRWAYVLYPGRADGDQLTGVLWNTRFATPVSSDGNRMSADAIALTPVPVQKGRSSQGSALWNRPPHAIKLSFGEGRTDIVLIVVHMKADYQGDFAAHRKEEADVLIGALPAIRKTFGDADILIMGDTNCVGLREPALLAFEKAGFVDLNASGLQTHWRGGTMDRGLVPLDQPEFKARAFGVFSDSYLRSRSFEPRDFKQRMSDHYLVYTTVRVMPDDD